MRRRRLGALALVIALLGLLVGAGSASAQVPAILGVDCKESPTPDMPGSGLAASCKKVSGF